MSDHTVTVLDKRLDLDLCSPEELVWAAEYVTPHTLAALAVCREIAERGIWIDWELGAEPSRDSVKAWGYR